MTWLIVVLAVVALAALAAIVFWQARSTALRRRFGSEYERAVSAHGGRRPAEAELREILRRREALDVRPLPAAVRVRFAEAWREAQLRFVDQPPAAVRRARGLVDDVLRERGYPADGEESVAMVSVDHPDLVADYRAARSVKVGEAGSAGTAGIDELREAFVRYRELFDRLMEDRALPDEQGTLPQDDEGERPTALSAAYGTVVGAARRANTGIRRRIDSRRGAERESRDEPDRERSSSDR
jgi:hypothetical protein